MTTMPTPAAAPAADVGVSGATNDGAAQDTSVDNTEFQPLDGEEWTKLSKRKVKHKVDGKDVELTLEEALKGYSHSSAANKRFEEAAAIKKQVQQDKMEMEKLLSNLKDPKAAKQLISKHLGEEGFSQLAHEHVMEALRRESMTPEELQSEEDARELKTYREEQKRQKDTMDKAAKQQTIDKLAEDVMSDIGSTLGQLGVQPQPYELDSLLGVMIDAMEQGVELSPMDAWHHVHRQEQARFDRYLANVDVTKLPKEFIEKVRQHSVAELPFRTKSATPKQEAPEPEQKMSSEDFFNNLRKGRK